MMRRVLVVDDEPLLADTLCAILVRHGFACSVAYGGEAALVLAGQFLPDTLLTDVMMPGMNGIELAERLCQSQPGVRVLLFSGQSATSDLLALAGEPACRWELLPKPMPPEELIGLLRRPDSGR